jgi:hypothetical protein
VPRLSFTLGFKSNDFQQLDLPIEIRKANFSLVKRTLSSDIVDLPSGVYSVLATLPAGQQLFSNVAISDSDANVVLTPNPDQESPHESHEQYHFNVRSLSVLAESDAVPETHEEKEAFDVGLSVLAGRDPFSAETTAEAVNTRQFGEGLEFYYYPWPPQSARFLEIQLPNKTASYVALPASEGKYCRVVLMRDKKRGVSIEAHLQHPEADLLVRGLQRGYLEQSALAVTSDSMGARRLLPRVEEIFRNKMADPIAAAVAAYTLLQFGELDRLHDWTANLMNWFEWLPDGLAIRGEHLALLGKHEEALDILSKLHERGVPLFSTGLSYAVERLRLYIATKDERFAREDVERAETTLGYLQDCSGQVDLRKAVLTMPGVKTDPNRRRQPSGRALFPGAPVAVPVAEPAMA